MRVRLWHVVELDAHGAGPGTRPPTGAALPADRRRFARIPARGGREAYRSLAGHYNSSGAVNHQARGAQRCHSSSKSFW
jgi:hypothetical protein